MRKTYLIKIMFEVLFWHRVSFGPANAAAADHNGPNKPGRKQRQRSFWSFAGVAATMTSKSSTAFRRASREAPPFASKAVE